uniref:Uncharacterized protein n=1 Tax=Rhizophora mucronata TaxID=61149 RepID=A0A2P2PA36_RHIMU
MSLVQSCPASQMILPFEAPIRG